MSGSQLDLATEVQINTVALLYISNRVEWLRSPRISDEDAQFDASANGAHMMRHCPSIFASHS